ncbi:PLC-like phosphodiesterase [Lyophyllum atratum]|nr:PLC-like phosphodiesterase [Lyophyllum atratum]
MHSGLWAASWALLLAANACTSMPIERATLCNGHAELCSRRYSNVTFIGAHDSFAFSRDPFALARDQEFDIPTQLGLGVRLLQAQAHENGNGELHFCHTNCLLFDGGKVIDYLKNVKTFLDANPNEVLTLLFTNPEGLSVKDAWKPIFDEAGITPLIYVPPIIPLKQDQWPTLGEMLDTGKRVVVFMDADTNPTLVDFILPEFGMIWETPFSVTDATFPCRVDRIHGPFTTEDHMYMINHSLNKDLFNSGVIVSDPFDARTTNGITSIMDHVNACAPLGGGRACAHLHPTRFCQHWTRICSGGYTKRVPVSFLGLSADMFGHTYLQCTKKRDCSTWKWRTCERVCSATESESRSCSRYSFRPNLFVEHMRGLGHFYFIAYPHQLDANSHNNLSQAKP